MEKRDDRKRAEELLPPDDFGRGIIGYRRDAVDAWVAQARHQVAGLAREAADRAAAASEVDALRSELAERATQLRVLEERLASFEPVHERAQDLVAQAERVADQRVSTASEEVAALRHRAERLIELQASVSSTLGLIMEQVAATMSTLHQHQPSTLALDIVHADSTPAFSPAQPERPGAPAPAPAAAPAPAPAPPRPEPTTPAAEARVPQHDNVHLLAHHAEVSARARQARATAVPTPTVVPHLPAPEATARRSDHLSPVDSTVRATGLAHYSDLAQLERHLAALDCVLDLHVDEFSNGNAVVRLNLAQPSPLRELLEQGLDDTWSVGPSEDGHSGEVSVRREGSIAG